VSGDILPPRTALAIGEPSFDDGVMTYVTNTSLLGLNAEDDKLVVGDGLGMESFRTPFSPAGEEYGGLYLDCLFAHWLAPRCRQSPARPSAAPCDSHHRSAAPIFNGKTA
jgi:hypothetical protein